MKVENLENEIEKLKNIRKRSKFTTENEIFMLSTIHAPITFGNILTKRNTSKNVKILLDLGASSTLIS